MSAERTMKSYTDEQQRIIDYPAETMLVVTAGAGTGKTHTMVGRIEHLLRTQALRPYEVLVLSFARSAVRELKTRLAASGEAGRLVSARTFDSWALDLLTEFEADRDWHRMGFDARIENAARLVRSGVADERLEDVGHLVIDEAQDVVGVRLELVKALISNTDCGLTVVGDAAQSIYGFQIESPEERRRGADLFLGWLRSHFGDELTEVGLEQNFRADTAEARTALGFGPALRRSAETKMCVGGAYDRLRTALLGVFYIGDLTDPFVCRDLGGGEGTTAVLCRTNGEVLLASEHLAAAAVPHALQRTAHDRVSPAWVATLFRDARAATIDRDAFDHLVAPLLSAHHDPDLTWSLLRRHHGDRGRRVDLGQLRRALAERRLPDELTAQPPADLIVSTFHRAKGLEFDRVVVMDPGSSSPENSDTPEEEEARLLYVAMTRPRSELMRTDSVRLRTVRHDPRIGRYIRFGFKKWQRFGVEVMGDDVDFTDPPGGSEQAVDVQARLATAVSVGDPVVLEQGAPAGAEAGTSPSYLITHDGVVIGTASEAFRRVMFRVFGGRPGYEPQTYPRRITGLRLDAVESAAGGKASGQIAGLGDHGVWLVPRLVGLSRFEFDRKDPDA
ncbi:UvrD-helicase domain-containing protein [Pseudonocardia sp. CA-142604]|uniref:UvrD-helicase domain-containing protein n=1 Tax=Pseudonocardia sp. CA-142604 TaxID=3240024 RepID=UPI003D9257E8